MKRRGKLLGQTLIIMTATSLGADRLPIVLGHRSGAGAPFPSGKPPRGQRLGAPGDFLPLCCHAVRGTPITERSASESDGELHDRRDRRCLRVVAGPRDARLRRGLSCRPCQLRRSVMLRSFGAAGICVPCTCLAMIERLSIACSLQRASKPSSLGQASVGSAGWNNLVDH